MNRLPLKSLLAVVAVLSTVAVAWGYWSAPGEGTGSGSLGALTPPTNVDVNPDPSTGTHTVSWTAATLTPAVGGITYTVERTLATDDDFQPVTSGDCATPPTTGTLECEDTVGASGSYLYRVVAQFRSWTAVSDEAGVSVTVAGGPEAPSAVSLANGAGVGNAYVNAANRASLSVNVLLPAGSKDTDTVHVTITDGTNETTERTVAASNGAGTVQVTGIDGSGLNDGPVTIHAWATNDDGASSHATTLVTKDTVKPSSAAGSVASITSGTTFTVPYTSADASPSSSLDKVELYVDDPGAGGFVLAAGVTDTTPSASGESFSYTGATQDGTYGFYTRATDKAGNVEDAPGAADQTATRDTDPAPKGLDVQGINGNNTNDIGRLRPNDKLVLTFDEAIKSTSILSTWTNPAAPLTGQSMVLKEGGAMDRLEALGSLNIGIVDLKANFVENSDVTFAVTLALNASRDVLTITFGASSGSGTLRNGSSGAVEMQWTPDADITDDSNQGIDTTPVIETGGSDSDF